MRALYSYAAVQLWAEAVNRAGTAEVQAVALALRAHRFDTILQPSALMPRGRGPDMSLSPGTFDGEYRPLQEEPASI